MSWGWCESDVLAGSEVTGREGCVSEQTAEAVAAGAGGRAGPGSPRDASWGVVAAEAARRHGVSSATVGNWRDRFVDAGKAGMDRSLPGPDGGQSQTERRLRHECEQLKLALAEATVQLRIWQKGSEYVDEVPSPTSRP
jgi:transposase